MIMPRRSEPLYRPARAAAVMIGNLVGEVPPGALPNRAICIPLRAAIGRRSNLPEERAFGVVYRRRLQTAVIG